MNEATSLSVLLLAAVGIGAVHALAPDHWLPIAAVARTRDYGRRRTALLTVPCGLVHLAVSASLGLVALHLGSAWAVAVADRLAALVGSLVIAGGLTWAPWSLHRALSRPQGDAVGQRFLRLGLGGLVLFFTLDACVALVPSPSSRRRAARLPPGSSSASMVCRPSSSCWRSPCPSRPVCGSGEARASRVGGRLRPVV